MSKFARILSIGVLVGGAWGCVCWAAGNKVVSGGELLRAVRERDGQVRKLRAKSRTSGGNNKRRASVLALLAKYGQTQDRLWRSFIIKAEEEGMWTYSRKAKQNVKRLYTHEWRWDESGTRFKHIQRAWGWVSPKMPNRPRDKKIHNSWLWDGERFYSYVKHLTKGDKDPPGYPGKVFVDTRETMGLERLVKTAKTGMRFEPFSGYVYSKDDGERIDKVVLRDKHALVQERMERVGDSQCYVISSAPQEGVTVKIWIDPQHGYNIAKYEYGVREGYLTPSGRRFAKGDFNCLSGKVLSFGKIDTMWVPMEIETENELRYASVDESYQRGKLHYKRTEFVPDPDHDALGSFLPADITNGALVWLGSANYRWKDGEVVDGQGFKVSLDPNQGRYPPVLVDKVLAGLDEFGLRLERNQTKDRRILVCFWDINQRPSRNCVQELAKKAELLADKGVCVVLLQAGMVDDKRLRAWLEEHKITLPVGKIKGDVEAVSRKWGVRSLPWLILTDRNHVVTAEGFGLEELDDTIKERENAKR